MGDNCPLEVLTSRLCHCASEMSWVQDMPMQEQTRTLGFASDGDIIIGHLEIDHEPWAVKVLLDACIFVTDIQSRPGMTFVTLSTAAANCARAFRK